jgi:hypothetical protein
MNNVTWSFSDFVRWLRTKSETLRGLGATIDFHVNEAFRASVRLRVERGKQLGELTVWEDGAAHMAVLDLASGDFVFERDGVSLAEASSSSELKEFFERLEAGV